MKTITLTLIGLFGAGLLFLAALPELIARNRIATSPENWLQWQMQSGLFFVWIGLICVFAIKLIQLKERRK
jgi:hypothetical protein